MDRSSRQVVFSGMLVVAALTAQTAAFAQTNVFSDDFNRADGPLSGWTIAAGTPMLQGGAMQIGPTTVEHWVWAGSPAVNLPLSAENVVFEIDLEFLAPGSNAVVGRHGGLAFCASEPTTRIAATFSGYFIDWIDRSAAPDDRGIRINRVDNGVATSLGVQGSLNAPLDPPLTWRVEIDDTNIRVYGDDDLYWDIPDATHRGGHFGVWTWSGGQEVEYDNCTIEAEFGDVAACFGYTPSSPVAGTDIFFDAGCSVATGNIVSYDWNMGDGTVLAGETVEHTYAFGDNYTVTLTVEDQDGNTDETSQIVAVNESLLPYTDDFERPAGPVDGWTVASGQWTINADGELESLAAGVEAWAFAGDPAGVVSGDFVAEFDADYISGDGAVGRHGGFVFFASQPLPRGQISGYVFDWIDRAGDRGVRLDRRDIGGNALLVPGPTAPALPEPPRHWRLEVEGENIRVYGDGVLYVDVIDNTYRSGHVGFWGYSNNNLIQFDNLVIDTAIDIELSACFPAPSAVAFVGDPVPFDGSCSLASEGVAISSYAWDFGDGDSGSGAMVSHAYDAPGIYTVSLTVSAGGEMDTLERTVTVHGRVTSFADNFSSNDISTWQVGSGDTWDMTGGLLTAGPTTAEHFIWGGNPAVALGGDAVFEFDYTFLALGDDPVVGRHGGFQFHCSRPTARAGGNLFSGYFVDWIDRVTDVGVRLSRADNGAFPTLAFSTVPVGGGDPITEPPLDWRVEVDGPNIRVYGDGDLFIDVVDSTYRGGFFGFWTWTGGQLVEIDAINATSAPLTSCFEVVQDFPLAGAPVSFDAGCSYPIGNVTITSYAWDFGDGGSGSGASVAHTYDFADSYTVSLTVNGSDGSSVSIEKVVGVSDALIPYADCFDGAAGPPDGWTIAQGDWMVNLDGELDSLAPGVEAWAYAGDPPLVASGDLALEVDTTYVSGDGDVGRHGGVVFFASSPTPRGQFSGYYFDWIDRPTDRGVRFLRADNGVSVALVPGPTDPPPVDVPSHWRLEVEGENIRVYGDDVLYVDVVDDTYREGYVGFWGYLNNTNIRFDNLQVGSLAGPLPECGEPPTPRFRRGDADGVGVINLTDGVFLLNFLFLGGPVPPCLDAADANDDGQLNITTGVFVFNWLFLGGPPPPAPGSMSCGADPTPDPLDCASYDNC